MIAPISSRTLPFQTQQSLVRISHNQLRRQSFELACKLASVLGQVAAVVWLGLVSIGSTCSAQSIIASSASSEKFRPNILWLTSEDTGTEIGCYGDEFADTPNIDALAAKGMKFAKAWSNAPVCAPARTTIVSGMYPTSLGAQHMRSAVRLPDSVNPYPKLMKEQGYYCTNNSKTDYNLQVNEKNLWDESSNKAHWRNRKPGQPFFAVFNFTISHESKIRDRPHQAIHDPAKVKLPPYHPDTPEVRQDWAQYYDRVTEMDQKVGEVLRQLEADGLSDSTVVFYYGDHGSGMPRGKRWLYESGLRVPLVVHIPDRIRPLIGGDYEKGSTSNRLVSFVDLVPTILSIAGVRPTDTLQGNAFLGNFAGKPSEYLYAFRDRMDERYDMSRAVRDDRYSYIRNFMPYRPQGMYLEYMFETPTTVAWKKEFDEGRLNAAQSFFWKTKPGEELYDLKADPYQINNLAGLPEMTDIQQRLSEKLHQWMIQAGDTGLLPEGEMWSRAGNLPPMDLTKNSKQFPVSEILEVAELASTAKPGDFESLSKHCTARDSASRFWAVGGLLLRAQIDQDREACVKAARGMSSDSSPYVRALAHETLARFGSAADRETSIKALLRQADIRSEGFFQGLIAFNSLDWCELTQQQIGTSLDGIPAVTNNIPPRYNTYIPRMIERLRSTAK